jgi:hypothetical protein
LKSAVASAVPLDPDGVAAPRVPPAYVGGDLGSVRASRQPHGVAGQLPVDAQPARVGVGEGRPCGGRPHPGAAMWRGDGVQQGGGEVSASEPHARPRLHDLRSAGDERDGGGPRLVGPGVGQV